MITLTTDFATRDGFVGTMKGVILGIDSRARLVDLTHEVPAGDVWAGSFTLACSYRFFPKGTIHVAVVDPGVGGPRRAIVARTRRYTFVGPDNGVLSLALAREQVRSVRLLANPKLFARTVSNTFHGRDVFAPAAAHLSRGVGFKKVGPRAGSYIQLNWPEPRTTESGIKGEIIHFDHFGNAITNIPDDSLPAASDIQVELRDKPLCRVEQFYGAVSPGDPAAVPGSSGFLEIAINGGSAAKDLRLERGTSIVLRFQGPAGGCRLVAGGSGIPGAKR